MSDEKQAKPAIEEMSHRAVVNQLKDLGDEIRRVASKDEILPEDEKYLRELEEDFDRYNVHRKKLERDALVERVDVETGKPLKAERGHTPTRDLDNDPFGEPRSLEDPGVFGNPFNLDEMRRMMTPQQEAAELRARALSGIEKMAASNDDTKQAMTEILERWDNPKTSTIARHALLTGNPDYVRGFWKVAQEKSYLLTDKEKVALERAMSLTDNAGGYLIPFQLDPAVIITSDGTRNDIRNAARVVVATGDTWNGVSAGATSWSFDAEAAEVSDDASTFAQPSIPVHMARGFVPISIEAFQDEQNVAQEVGRLLAFGKEELEATVFATGTGSGEPTGIVTALNGAAPPVIAATTNNSFGFEDVYLLEESLPARYRPRASWLAANAIYNDIRQFDTQGGAQLWERIGADRPPLLLGRPALEAEAMDSAIATGDDYVLCFGDFSNYVIADRIGTTIELVQHLFSTGSGRPTGQRGWFAYYRVGADSVNDGGFKLLRV